VRAEHVNYGEQANTQEDIDDSNWDRKPQVGSSVRVTIPVSDFDVRSSAMKLQGKWKNI